jgi:ketol-acid reductoisomerase
MLIPDQFQPALFNEKLAPKLKPDVCVVVASGYNYFYNKLSIPKTADVIMLAPRMIGTSVRSLFEKGKGFPCFISSEQNGTGKADEICLSLALGIGALKTGAIQSSCREETLIDLFAEQALFPTVIKVWELAYETLKKLGASDEALCYELWMSKEAAEIFEKMADDGFVKQLVHHSSVSQYGQLKGSLEYDSTIADGLRKEFERVAEKRVLNGAFEKDFDAMERSEGGVQGELEKLYEKANKSELAVGEKKVRDRLDL